MKNDFLFKKTSFILYQIKEVNNIILNIITFINNFMNLFYLRFKGMVEKTHIEL